MAIYTNTNGKVVEITPRVKYNGDIVIPVSGWTKKDGVLVKIWDKYSLLRMNMCQWAMKDT